MMNSDLVTVMVGCYGDYFDLHKRCIDSILMQDISSNIRILVAFNSVGDSTREYISEMSNTNNIEVFETDGNIHKLGILKLLFSQVKTKYAWWFDDDSFFTKSDALSKHISIAELSEEDVVLFGQKYYYKHDEMTFDSAKKKYLLKNYDWISWFDSNESICRKDYTNFIDMSGGKKLWFITGGHWLVDMKFINLVQYPPADCQIPVIDDIIMSHLVWFTGYRFKNCKGYGVANNKEKTRQWN